MHLDTVGVPLVEHDLCPLRLVLVDGLEASGHVHPELQVLLTDGGQSAGEQTRGPTPEARDQSKKSKKIKKNQKKKISQPSVHSEFKTVLLAYFKKPGRG